MSERIRWYDRFWLVILLLIIFLPVGFYAVYKNTLLSKSNKMFLSIFGVLLFAMITQSPEKYEANRSNKKVKDSSFAAGNKIVESKPDKFDAFFMSQKFVTARLKAPKTAEFPKYKDEFVSDLGSGRFRVDSYVDSQNSFGAMLRTEFICIVRSSDGNQWILDSFKLLE